MNFLYSEWLKTLEKDGVVVVATMVNASGAVPRENGAQMLIKKSGEIFETVGGGRLEGDVIARARAVLTSGQSELSHFDLTGKDVALTDMICGGKGDVFLYHSGEGDIAALQKVLRAQNMDGWMYFPIDEEAGISFVSADGAMVGDESEIARIAGIEKSKDICIREADELRYLVQWLETSGKLHIMGAGHVSMQIAKVAHTVDIECCVYDDRAEFLTEERFPYAQKIVLDDMKKLPDISAGKKDMIAVVTRGHLFDKECLEWALGYDAGYVGMIGSKRKVNMIYDSLLDSGISKEKIEQVYAPIGLDIGALTPAEIAVAIVAELIQNKRQSK